MSTLVLTLPDNVIMTVRGKCVLSYLQSFANDLGVRPLPDGNIDVVALYKAFRQLVDADEEKEKMVRRAESLLGMSKVGVHLEDITKLDDENRPTYSLKTGRGLFIKISQSAIDIVEAARPPEEFEIVEEPKTRPPLVPQQNGEYTKLNLELNPALAAKIKRIEPQYRENCIQEQYHESQPWSNDPCDRMKCPFYHNDQWEYSSAADYQRAVNDGQHSEWKPHQKKRKGPSQKLVARKSTMDRNIDSLKRKGKGAGVDQEAQDAKKLKLEKDEHEDLLNLPLNALLELSPEDMPMKVRRPDGHMVLTWSDKAIQKLKALRQEASRKEEDTADKNGETNNEEVAAGEEGTTEKRGAWIESEHAQVWKDK